MPTLAIIGTVIASIAIAVLVYLYVIRRWHQRWGANEAEVESAMVGDDEVKNPMHVTTRAVTVTGLASDIWPWLVQMGYRRGGMYSYDWIDRLLGILDRPSANEIIPEFQHLEVGDVIPMGSGPNWPVKAIEPNRVLLLVIKEPGVDVSWSFLLYETDNRHTRLILRVRTRLAMTLLVILATPIIDIGEFLMVRKMLLGIKRRAEMLAKKKSEQ